MTLYLHQLVMNIEKYTVTKLVEVPGSNCMYESPTGELVKVNARDIGKPKKVAALKTNYMYSKQPHLDPKILKQLFHA